MILMIARHFFLYVVPSPSNCWHHHLKWRPHRIGLPKNLVSFVSPARRPANVYIRFICKQTSLEDRRRSEDLCNLLGINCVADVVRRGRLRWFGHLERKNVDDWLSACRGLVVEGARGRGRSRKTWEQCVRDDMKLLGLHPEWAIFKDMWRDLIWGKRLTLAQRGKRDVFKINDDDDDDETLKE